MIFVDESIQHTLGYICVGFAYCAESPDDQIQQALIAAGLTPGADEYKSGYRMRGRIEREELRNSIKNIVLENCKFAIYIADIGERAELRTHVAEIAKKIVEANDLQTPQTVFLDQGIDGKTAGLTNIRLKPNCDSRSTFGIQLADFVAYHCSYILKCSILESVKTISMPLDEPHPLAGEDVELDWIFRTNFRRNFFMERRNIEEIQGDDWFFKLSGYGAFFSPRLNEKVESAAEKNFDSMYLGCVW